MTSRSGVKGCQPRAEGPESDESSEREDELLAEVAIDAVELHRLLNRVPSTFWLGKTELWT